MKSKISPSTAFAETMEVTSHPSENAMMYVASSTVADQHAAPYLSADGDFSAARSTVPKATPPVGASLVDLESPPSFSVVNTLSWKSTDHSVEERVAETEALEIAHPQAELSLPRASAAAAPTMAATGDVILRFDLWYSLGFTIESTTLSVLEVVPGSQAEKLGVRSLWTVASANGAPCLSQENFDSSLAQARQNEDNSENSFTDHALIISIGFYTLSLNSSRSDDSEDGLSCQPPPIPMPFLTAFFPPTPVATQTNSNDSPNATSELASDSYEDGSSLESDFSDADDFSEHDSNKKVEDCGAPAEIDSKPNVSTTTDVEFVREHWAFNENWSMLYEMAQKCPCGNIFMHDCLFCQKCGIRRIALAAVDPSETISASSQVLVITLEEIERRAMEKNTAAVNSQLPALTERLTNEIEVVVKENVAAELFAEWEATVNAERERVEALRAHLISTEAETKAVLESCDVLETKLEAGISSTGEHAAMEAKLTEREAEVTAEYEVQTSQKRECNEMKSNATSLETQLAEQRQTTERAEAEKAASESAATSAAAEHKREMTALQSEVDALQAEKARSEAAHAEKVAAASTIKAKKEKAATYLGGFMQVRLRRTAAGSFAKLKLHVVHNQIVEKRGRIEYMHVLETEFLVKEHKTQWRNIRNAATQQRLVYEATIRELKRGAAASSSTLVQRPESLNAPGTVSIRATTQKRRTTGL